MKTTLLLILLFLFQNLPAQIDTFALYKKDTLTLNEAKILQDNEDDFLIMPFDCRFCQINADKRFEKPYLDSIINLYWKYCYNPCFNHHCQLVDYSCSCLKKHPHGDLNLWVYYDGISAERIVLRGDTAKYTGADLRVYLDEFLSKTGLSNYAALAPYHIENEEYFLIDGKRIYWDENGVKLIPKIQYYIGIGIMNKKVKAYAKY
ncbi:MAG: hypothetical protein M0D57_06010 [Sphingobacteriales bacterium JAD_PAG50586_3]|nr:MAG: hypothetical protein M0D57_06010 [Sphingobacteriales bacterium JAD_PAG50586_3]